MSRSTADRLHDILHSSDLAAQHASGLDAESLAVTTGRRDATLFRIAVLCEAASQLPAEVQALAPEIPWQSIRSMRNRIIHRYCHIDYGIVLDTIANDLEPLKAAARRLMELLNREPNGD
jgi:uncharacterized protein with HEPN domain